VKNSEMAKSKADKLRGSKPPKVRESAIADSKVKESKVSRSPEKRSNSKVGESKVAESKVSRSPEKRSKSKVGESKVAESKVSRSPEKRPKGKESTFAPDSVMFSKNGGESKVRGKSKPMQKKEVSSESEDW
jgi:hypothetical protein